MSLQETGRPSRPKRRRVPMKAKAPERRRLNKIMNCRVSDAFYAQIVDAARRSRRNVSEEVLMRLNRDFEWERARSDIHELHRQAAAAVSEANVQALRLAGIQILRGRPEGSPTRVVVDLETLMAERDGLAHGLRAGFVAQELPPAEPQLPLEPAPTSTSEMTGEEALRTIAELKRVLLGNYITKFAETARKLKSST